MTRRPNHRQGRRRGLTSVVLLIGLLILGIVAANLVRVERTRRDRARLEERVLQAEALAEAGLDRAVAHLRVDPKFEGETWEPTPDDLGGSTRGRVVTTVRPDPAGPPSARLIATTAELTHGPDRAIRQARTLTWRPDSTQP